MSQVVKIFLPLLPIDAGDVLFKGHLDMKPDCLTIFITTYHRENKSLDSDYSTEKNTIYGYWGDNPPITLIKKYFNSFIIYKNQYPKITNLLINGVKRNITENYIIMLYDYKILRSSETLHNNNDCFSILKYLIHKDAGELCGETEHKTTFESLPWLESSMFGQHMINYFKSIKWLLDTVRKKERITIKHGNLIMSILVDILLGYLLLKLILFDKKEIGKLLLGALEKLINLMYSLLKWLMGAPAGLKLNNAFNKMLGKYFLYHVELWWLFLDVSGEKLDLILHIFQYLGYMGFTFQAAIISDMICLATFHSYCIYVYAARLFNIQISGLTALLRLFVGRKYNPLRGGIDSCEYTNQELFVGTVAFTILLLLLPTTLMYYIVFTMFRVMSLSVQYILAKLIHMLQTLPFYVVTLWITRSPKIAGNIIIEKVKSDSVLILNVKLCNKSFQDLMNEFTPPVGMLKKFEWSNIISSVFTGRQII